MLVKTKFNTGDLVWIIHQNQICLAEVKALVIKHDPEAHCQKLVTYSFDDPWMESIGMEGKPITRSEAVTFGSIDQATEWLSLNTVIPERHAKTE